MVNMAHKMKQVQKSPLLERISIAITFCDHPSRLKAAPARGL
jgi:hypothetical protein